MNNITIKTSGDKLTLMVDLSKDFGASKSGKNILIASSKGNVEIDGHPGVYLGLNVYRKATGK